jgi:hypothetical protein
MVFFVDVVGLSRLEVLLAKVYLFEVATLRVLLVSSGDGRGRTFDLLHLLEVKLERPLFHVDVGQLALSLRIEHIDQ